jgi:hypothetical protein
VLAAVSGSLLPSCPWRVALDSRVFTRPAIQPYRSKTESPLLSLRPPSENAAHRAAAAPFPTEVVRDSTGSSREVSSPSAFPRPGQRHEIVIELPTLDRPPPSGFLDLMASSSAPDLLALFHARSAPGVLPSELCSSRAAVRRLRRRCPPVVGAFLRPARAPTRCRGCRSTAPNPRAPMVGGPLRRPSPSGLCSTRESTTSDWLFRPPRARSSPGLLPFRVFPLAGIARPSPCAPLMRFPAWAQASARDLCRVFLPGEIGLSLSRLPTLLGFATS